MTACPELLGREARQMFQEMVQGLTAQLGTGHVDTVKAKMNLAILLVRSGKHEEALPLLEEAATGFATELGPADRLTEKAEETLQLVRETLGETPAAPAAQPVTVVLRGLVGAPHLNGERATVTKFSVDRGHSRRGWHWQFAGTLSRQ